MMSRREVYDIREKMRAVSVPFLYFFPSQTKSFPLVYTRLSLLVYVATRRDDDRQFVDC